MTDYERGYEQGKADAMKGAQQEPVAWIYIDPKWKRAHVNEVDLTQIPKLDEWYPIYFKPQRPWVGLTDEEMEGLYESATYMDKTDCIHLLMLAADKLKEKNT